MDCANCGAFNGAGRTTCRVCGRALTGGVELAEFNNTPIAVAPVKVGGALRGWGIVDVEFEGLNNAPTATAPVSIGGLYSGWGIVAVAFLAGMASSSSIAVFPHLYRVLRDEVGWGANEIIPVFSNPALQIAALGLLPAFVGYFINRNGVRMPILIGGGLVGAGFVGMSQTQSLAQLSAAVTAVLAGAGIGLSNMVITVVVANWFVRLRGRAMALALSGGIAGNMVTGLVLPDLIAIIGWRSSLIAFGVFIWTVTIPSATLLVRRRPEDIGLFPDGTPPTHRDGFPSSSRFMARNEAMRTQNIRMNEITAIATPTFAIFLVVFTLTSAVVSGSSVALGWLVYELRGRLETG